MESDPIVDGADRSGRRRRTLAIGAAVALLGVGVSFVTTIGFVLVVAGVVIPLGMIVNDRKPDPEADHRP